MVQIDIPARRLYAFGGTFTPADTAVLAVMGLLATFSVFLFTALYGRLWCGYACPQTVFLEEWVRPLERWIEGERATRMARDRGHHGVEWYTRRGLKWAAFLALSVAVALALVSWFAGAHATWTLSAGGWANGFVAVLAGLLFLDLAWFREQLCNLVCPYARFQGVLCDNDSLVVAYDPATGEPRFRPRGGMARAVVAASEEGRPGACIDCRRCVAVCPQGIDIREGFQLECVMCARCVDACTDVMQRRGLPTLVRYASLSGARRSVRPRTVAYGLLVAALTAVLGALIATRHSADGIITRAPGTFYTVDADGGVRNTYILRLSSRRPDPTTWTVDVEGMPPGADWIAPDITLEPSASAQVPVVVRLPSATQSERILPLRVVVRTGTDVLALDATFLTPGS
jgi:cytochrome c oxidase accessory protein FixG